MNEPRGAVAKAMAILQALGDAPEGLRLSDLAELVGLHGSTAHRTSAELVASGFVVRGTNDRYYLGPAFLRLAQPTSLLGAVRFEIRATLEEVVAESGLMANAQVLEPDGSRILDAVKPARYRSLRDFRGEVVLSHTAAGGLVLLAFGPRAAREHAADRVERLNGPAARADLVELLAATHEQGHATLMGALDSVLGAVSVPVLDPQVGCILALTAVGLITDVRERHVSEITEPLRRAAKRLVPLVRPPPPMR